MRTSSSSPRRPTSRSSWSANGQLLGEHVAVVLLLDPQRIGVVQHRGRRRGRRRPPRRRPAADRRPTSSSPASRARSTGTGANDSLDGGEVLAVGRLPPVEPRVGDLVGQQPVGHHRVDPVAEQRQVGVGAAGLGDHHALGVDDQSHARHRRVGQQLLDPVETVVEAAGRPEHLVAGHRQVRHPAEHGSDHAVHATSHREDALHVPRRGCRAGSAAGWSRPSARSRRRARPSPRTRRGS